MLASLLSYILLFTCVDIVLPSMGDRDHFYNNCWRSCAIDCPSNSVEQIYILFPSWNCVDNCQYKCMHEITKVRVENGYPVLKYNGHWPFKRYLDLEEPSSVLFSLLNAIPHIFRIGKILRNDYSEASFMTSWLVPYSFIATNAWLVSAVFHARKTNITTQLDYLSALLFLVYSLWLVILRMIGRVENSRIVSLIFCLVFALLLYQMILMIQGRIDHGTHMTVCIAVSVTQVVLWFIWAVFFANKKSHRWLCVLCQIWFGAAAMLEIFDFPPFFGLFDAHSLWHAATIPLGFVWYRFWDADARCLLTTEQSPHES